MTEDNEIRFFNRDREEYGWMSNFSKHPIYHDDTIFPTVEHYYQFMKAYEPDEMNQIRLAPTPGEAKRLGRKCKINPNWEKMKYGVLKIGVLQKFLVNHGLAQKLIATGNKRILEDSDRDYIWGIGADGTGQNLMGKILEEVREILKGLNRT